MGTGSRTWNFIGNYWKRPTCNLTMKALWVIKAGYAKGSPMSGVVIIATRIR